eukprot:TRINITY_DN5959_c0_g1_i3.p1 TRINITY_DN5959_c0_g1~~TRINITY_DN5959_c0_g1_i3.p1  ORF type:complete len:250 (-),score=44.85 TRINITY_DN5959_c0_g1_i3:165-914(-)
MKTKGLKKLKPSLNKNRLDASSEVQSISYSTIISKRILPLRNLARKDHKHSASLGVTSYNMGNKTRVVFNPNPLLPSKLSLAKDLKDTLKISPYSKRKQYDSTIPEYKKYSSLVKKPCLHFSKTHKPTNILRKKFAVIERTFANYEDTQDIEERVRRELDMEDYKQRRLERTSKLLNEIDTTDPATVERMYRYKLDSTLFFQNECYKIKRRLCEMLEDPKRLVARIERRKRVKPLVLSLNKRLKSLLDN